jgi:uncharacterized membrane protein
MAISDAERQRRSDQTKRMHREGKLGSHAVSNKAAARSAEVRTARASSIARRLLEEHEEEVRKTLLEIIAKGTRSERLKAIDIMVKAGLRGESVGLTEEKMHGEQRSREELIALLADKLSGGSLSGQLVRARLAERNREVIEGHAVETRALEHPPSVGV